MKKLLLPIICLLVVSIPAGAQWPRKDDSYDRKWNLQERERSAHGKETGSGGDVIRYPTDSMSVGKGFSNGLAKVTVDGKAGYIGRDGRLVIKPRFDDAGRFSEGLAPVEVAGKWGYINKRGETVIPLKFDWALRFYEGRALVLVGEKWGYIDPQGKMVIEPQFEEAGSFSEGLARVVIYDKDFKWGFIDKVGKYRWGFIDREGKWALKPAYDSPVEDFNGGRARVSKDIGMNNGVVIDIFFIDKEGRSYPEPEADERFEDFEDLSPFSEGLATFRKDYKEGFVNQSGKVVIAPRFDFAGYFSEGLAPVNIKRGESYDGGWGYINARGETVIKSKFDWAWEFSEGRALVAMGDRVGYVDRAGRYIWEPSK
ncbi:MAG TPA: WG repeat-containing protein [Pyrinomonadaceae bacterium]|nr:WG repeat-containing protein [Pyrinomonadaceae bacterium]